MRQKGLTIIQLMVILLVLGLAGSYIVEFLIDRRCASAPDKALCAQREVKD